MGEQRRARTQEGQLAPILQEMVSIKSYSSA